MRRTGAKRPGKTAAPSNGRGVAGLQRWARAFDVERGWDAVLPSETAVHLMEEAGEVARAILTLGGYKRPVRPRRSEKRALGSELSDVVFLCCKLANQFGIDLARAIDLKISANERRFTNRIGLSELSRYVGRKAREWRRVERTARKAVRGESRTHLTF